MNGTWKFVAFLAVSVVAVVVLIKIFWWLMSIAIPVALVAAVGYVLYQMASRKPLGGGRRTTLP